MVKKRFRGHFFCLFYVHEKRKRAESGSDILDYWDLLEQNIIFFLQMACMFQVFSIYSYELAMAF